MAKIKHNALSTQDVEKTAKFYIDVFGMKEIGKIDSPNARGYYLSDGDLNLAILNFKNDAVAGVERGKGWSGIHHIGSRSRASRRSPSGWPPRARSRAMTSTRPSGSGTARRPSATATSRSSTAVLTASWSTSRRPAGSARPDSTSSASLLSLSPIGGEGRGSS